MAVSDEPAVGGTAFTVNHNNSWIVYQDGVNNQQSPTPPYFNTTGVFSTANVPLTFWAVINLDPINPANSYFDLYIDGVMVAYHKTFQHGSFVFDELFYFTFQIGGIQSETYAIDDITIFQGAIPPYEPPDPCVGHGGDTDGDGICDDVDNCPIDPENDIDGDGLCADDDPCPYDYFEHDSNGDGIRDCHVDSDEDGVFDPCDKCPHTPNGPDGGTCVRYEGDPKHVAEIGGPCLVPEDCTDTGTGWECNKNQEDTDEDLRGDACQYVSLTLYAPPAPDTFRPGQAIPVTVTIENVTGQPQRIIKPNCYSCSAGPLFTVLDKNGKRLRQIYRIGPVIAVPMDLITLSSSYSITCDIAPMFPDLTDPDPGDEQAEQYTVYATLNNGIVDPEFSLYRYVYSTGSQTLLIEGAPGETYMGNCIFDPAEWYAHWAVAGGPTVSAQITSNNFDVNNVVLSTILLNGSVPITGSDPVSNEVLTVRFDGGAAVQSFGDTFAGQATARITGEVQIPGQSETDFFRAEGIVQLKGNLMVRCDRHEVACGTHPNGNKYPIPYTLVRIFDKSPGSCAANYGISWQHYPDIYKNCVDWVAEATTGDNSQAEFVLSAGDYLVIAEYDPDEIPGSGDELYIGRSAGDFIGDSLMKKYIQVIEKCDKKKVPAKAKKLVGSELLIIEPEYVEWSGESELYPFVFESIGDWSVTTSVAPPEGFVADYDSLTEEVSAELEAVQFTVTDVGSKWKPTKVKYKIKHKGREESIESEIGVMLTPDLAKKKGVSIYGEEDKDKDKDKDKD